MARAQHSPETKAAVIAALLEGQAASKVAADYKLPEGTVYAWAARARKHDAGLATLAEQKKEEIGDLLVKYLRSNLVTLEAQGATFRDKAWLDKQEAAGLAVLHGVLVDKTVRLLEALGSADAPLPSAA